jgi:hypothetical protein
MGQFGKCPTCHGAVSTGADFCPHCGEREFFEVTPPDRKKYLTPNKFAGCSPQNTVIDLRTGERVG